MSARARGGAGERHGGWCLYLWSSWRPEEAALVEAYRHMLWYGTRDESEVAMAALLDWATGLRRAGPAPHADSHFDWLLMEAVAAVNERHGMDLSDVQVALDAMGGSEQEDRRYALEEGHRYGRWGCLQMAGNRVTEQARAHLAKGLAERPLPRVYGPIDALFHTRLGGDREVGAQALLVLSSADGPAERRAAALAALGENGLVTEAVLARLEEALDAEDTTVRTGALLAVAALSFRAADEDQALVAPLLERVMPELERRCRDRHEPLRAWFRASYGRLLSR